MSKKLPYKMFNTEKNKCRKYWKSAFSLIEISMILILISFLAFAVYYGLHLIRQAKLTAVIGEIDRIKLATGIFIDKYNELPGDGGDFVDTIEGLSSSDRGDSDWYIGDDSYKLKESHKFFKHLSYDDILTGRYDSTGVTLDVDGNIQQLDDVIVGQTFPGSKLKGSYFYYAESSDLNGKFLRRNRLAIFSTDGYGITSKDVYDIDRKIDDGLPFLGKVVSVRTNTSDLVANAHHQYKNYADKNLLQRLNPIKSSVAASDNTQCTNVLSNSYCDGITVDNLTTSNQLQCISYETDSSDTKGCTTVVSIEPKDEGTTETADVITLDCAGEDRNNYDCVAFCVLYPEDSACAEACSNNPNDPTLPYCFDSDGDGTPDAYDDENGDGIPDICDTEPTNPVCTQLECSEVTEAYAPSHGNATWPTAIEGTINVRGSCAEGFTENTGGYPIRDCSNGGSWASITNPCIATYCAQITTDGADSNSGYATWPETETGGTTVTDVSGTCLEGYTGSPTRDCSGEGLWQTVNNPCEPLTCAGSELGTIGAIIDLNATWNTGVDYDYPTYATATGCIADHYENPSGTATVQCGLSGWDTGTADNPCLEGCQYDDLVIPAGTIFAGSGLYEQNFVLNGSCDIGYSGTPTATCTNNAGTVEWEVVPCVAETCDGSELETIAEIIALNGVWDTGATYNDQDVATATECAFGFYQDPAGLPEVTCDAGSWDVTSVANACTPGANCSAGVYDTSVISGIPSDVNKKVDMIPYPTHVTDIRFTESRVYFDVSQMSSGDEVSMPCNGVTFTGGPIRVGCANGSMEYISGDCTRTSPNDVCPHAMRYFFSSMSNTPPSDLVDKLGSSPSNPYIDRITSSRMETEYYDTQMSHGTSISMDCEPGYTGGPILFTCDNGYLDYVSGDCSPPGCLESSYDLGLISRRVDMYPLPANLSTYSVNVTGLTVYFSEEKPYGTQVVLPCNGITYTGGPLVYECRNNTLELISGYCSGSPLNHVCQGSMWYTYSSMSPNSPPSPLGPKIGETFSGSYLYRVNSPTSDTMIESREDMSPVAHGTTDSISCLPGLTGGPIVFQCNDGYFEHASGDCL